MKLPAIFSIQLILVFFFPPFSAGDRNIFLSDLWCWLWVPLLMWDARSELSKKLKSPLFQILLASGLLIFLVYAHGAVRIPIQFRVSMDNFWQFSELDEFRPFRELVLFGRFLSWLWGAILIWYFCRTDQKLGSSIRITTLHTLASCAGVTGLAMMAAKIFPEWRNVLGRVFHYDPNFKFWADRMHGVFQSPNEAGIAMGLSALILVVQKPNALKIAGGLSAAGMLLAKTATAVIGFGLGAGVRFWNSKKLRRWVWIVVAGLGLIVLTTYLAEFKTFLSKANDLHNRLQVWGTYIKYSLARWDLFLLGYGFANYHMDSFVLFVFNRGGVISLAALGLFLSRWLKVSWKKWSPSQKAVFSYLFCVSFFVDALIYRHTVMIVLCAAIPYLAKNEARE